MTDATYSEEWDEARMIFRRIAARRGIRAVANEIPAGKDTVYRLIRGETVCHTRAVRAGIQRIIEQHSKEIE